MKTKLAFFLILNTLIATAQTKINDSLPKRNTIYVEVFGQGLNGSINYDRLCRLDKKVRTSFSVGAVIVPMTERFGDGAYLGVPASYNFLFGKRRNHLELGMGFTVLAVKNYYTSNNSFLPFSTYYSYFTPKLGYRFQSPKGGLFFRFTLTPMFAFINHSSLYSSTEYFSNVANLDYRAFPWFGVSAGWTIRH